MFSRKPQTILTSTKSNMVTKKARKSFIQKESELTSPAAVRDMYYINVAGVTMPIHK